MRPPTLQTPALGFARVGDGGAGDGADERALAVGLVGLEAGRALAPPSHGRQVLNAVARVGADKHRLPDQVVAGLAVRAQAEGVGDFGAGGGAVE